MTIRNQIIGAALSVAIALPMMAATATLPLPVAAAKAPAKMERAAKHHREHVRTGQAMHGDDDRRAFQGERRDHERKGRDHD